MPAQWKRLLTRIARRLNQNDPAASYRFLTRSWTAVSDAELAARVLQTECWQTQLRPSPYRPDLGTRLLVLAPHQDDEVLGCGGTMLLAKEAGASIGIVYLTDGAQSGVSYAATVAESREVRRQEAREVCSRLNAQLFELDIPNVDPRPTLDDVKKLADIIHQFAPTILVAPWLLDRPAKHRIASHMLWAAEKLHGLPDFEYWGCQLHNTLMPNIVVEITPVAEQKRELLQIFVSQNEHYQNYEHIGMAHSAWNSRLLTPSPQQRYAEPFLALPKPEMLNLIEQFYFQDLLQTYQGNASLAAAMGKLQDAVVGQGRGNA